MRRANLFKGTGPQKVPVSKVVRKGSAAGRPPKPVDWDLVRRLSMIHCTPSEIAAVCRLSYQSLVDRPEFPGIYEQGHLHGKASLRRMQWRKAVEGSERMLIFLGKVILQQREQPVIGESTTPEEDNNRPQLSNLSDKELNTLRILVEKASVNIDITVPSNGKVNGAAAMLESE